MILISNHLTQLDQFKELKDVVIRINMAHVKDSKQLKEFVNVPYDIFLDYPKGRSKPPTRCQSRAVMKLGSVLKRILRGN